MPKMYACNNCRKVFDVEESSTIHECVGEYMGQPAYLDYAACPYCGCDDLEEAEECECCGEYHHPEAIYHTSVGNYCEECTMDIWDEFNKIKEGKRGTKNGI